MEGLSAARALIVAVASYADPRVRDLPDAILNDADDIEAILLDPGICAFPRDGVKKLPGRQATREAVVAGLEWLRGGPAGLRLLFFSGHGTKSKAGDGASFLLPWDARADDFASSGIGGQALTDYLQMPEASRLLVLLDACHSAGAAELKTTGSDFKAGVNDTLLEELGSGRGRVLISSCDEAEFSVVIRGARNSVFTGCLIEGLRGAAAHPTDSFIRVLDLFEHVSEQVPLAAEEQHPVLKVRGLRENFPVALVSPTARAGRRRSAESEALLRAALAPDPKNRKTIPDEGADAATFLSQALTLLDGGGPLQALLLRSAVRKRADILDILRLALDSKTVGERTFSIMLPWLRFAHDRVEDREIDPFINLIVERFDFGTADKTRCKHDVHGYLGRSAWLAIPDWSDSWNREKISFNVFKGWLSTLSLSGEEAKMRTAARAAMDVANMRIEHGRALAYEDFSSSFRGMGPAQLATVLEVIASCHAQDEALAAIADRIAKAPIRRALPQLERLAVQGDSWPARSAQFAIAMLPPRRDEDRARKQRILAQTEGPLAVMSAVDGLDGQADRVADLVQSARWSSHRTAAAWALGVLARHDQKAADHLKRLVQLDLDEFRHSVMLTGLVQIDPDSARPLIEEGLREATDIDRLIFAAAASWLGGEQRLVEVAAQQSFLAELEIGLQQCVTAALRRAASPSAALMEALAEGGLV